MIYVHKISKVFVVILSLLLTPSIFASYIVKYKSGRVETSAVNPSEFLGTAQDSADADSIEYVEENTILRPHSLIPNDNFFSQQWALGNYLNYSFQRAKNMAGSSVNVAVIDTGITTHNDLAPNMIQGADFISVTSNSRDGNGRDMNPEDLGDYQGGGCSGNSNSTWHGTHIAGIIGAVSNNNYGVAGAASNVKMMALRVLGPCGGTTSDIADAIRWAAGDSVSGLSANQNRAKVINLSLGGRAACSRYMQEAIDYANSREAVVVVSAGNEADSVDNMEYTPANCRGVLRVGAIDSNLYQSNYSNYGDIVDISAPGDAIYSTLNSGFTTQGTASFGAMSGTSMSAGFISAAAALVFSVNPTLTGEQVKDALVRNSQYVYCRNSNCSGGSVDPYDALLDAQSLSRDESFVYDDPVVVGGYRSVSTNLNKSASSSGGGGLCGTIDLGGGKNPPNQNTLLTLLFLFATIIISRFKNLAGRPKV